MASCSGRPEKAFSTSRYSCSKEQSTPVPNTAKPSWNLSSTASIPSTIARGAASACFARKALYDLTMREMSSSPRPLRPYFDSASVEAVEAAARCSDISSLAGASGSVAASSSTCSPIICTARRGSDRKVISSENGSPITSSPLIRFVRLSRAVTKASARFCTSPAPFDDERRGASAGNWPSNIGTSFTFEGSSKSSLAMVSPRSMALPGATLWLMVPATPATSGRIIFIASMLA
mmetsp:Transcript_8565/g.34853  ORF Transcript_8565/g.34853 Transcript_8565/m.34853 type:complete len:235 (-) Transcript_8565:2069-2773(-)